MSVTLTDILIFEEGLRLRPYLCPAGYWTLGVGWNLEAHGLPAWACKEFFDTVLNQRNGEISRATALRLLDETREAAEAEALRWYKTSHGRSSPDMTEARRRACENMAFQLGYTRLAEFKKTQRYIQAGEWEEAAVECLDSKWAREDSPQRARRVARVFRTGDDAFYADLF